MREQLEVQIANQLESVEDADDDEEPGHNQNIRDGGRPVADSLAQMFLNQ